MLPIAIALFFAASTAQAVQISVPTVSAQPGGTVVADVQYASQGTQVTGVQMDIEYDPILAVDATIGPSGSVAGKSLTAADISTGKKRILIAGLNQNALGDGVLLSLKISVPSNAGSAQYSLHLSNAGGTDKDGKAISLSVADGMVVIGSPRPSVAAVVNAASFSPGVVDGSWLSVLGTALSSTTRAWRADEILHGRMPTSLDGVTVTFDGVQASISYVSPTQLNVQMPQTGRAGSVVGLVVSNNGVTSRLFEASVVRNSPGLFVFAQQGGKYPAAVIARSDGQVDYLGPTGLFATALATRPARTGETVELYATGLGPTTIFVPSGEVFSGAAPLVDPISVTIGGFKAPVTFAGLATAGLYQVNVTVPTLPPGDQSIMLTVNGISSQLGLLIPVNQ
jgi:uncharacterized protein (TIGR03437 family)